MTKTASGPSTPLYHTESLNVMIGTDVNDQEPSPHVKRSEKRVGATIVTPKKKSNRTSATVSEDSSPTVSSRDTRRSRASKEDVDEGEVEVAYTSLEKDGVMPKGRMAGHVMKLVHKKKLDALYHGDYAGARHQEQLTVTMATPPVVALQHDAEEERENDMSTRDEQVKHKLQREMDRGNARISHNVETLDGKTVSYEERHQREIQQFREKWQSPDTIRKFNKPSVRLLQMRYVERRLALQKKYEEAAEMKLLADETQRQEEVETQRLIEAKMQSDYAKIIERQQAELDRLEDKYDNRTQILQVDMGLRVEKAERAVTAMESKRKKPAKWQYMSHRRASLAAGKHGHACSTIPSPRTQELYLQYRSGKPGLLTLVPMDDGFLEKLPPRHATPSRQQQRRSQDYLIRKSSTP